MSVALPAPSPAGLFSHWTWQPLVLVAVVALAVWYVHGVRALRRTGSVWPARRSVAFGLGLALAVWTTCGFPQAYLSSLFWMWTAQQLALMLVIPVVVLSGGPLQLALARSGERGRTRRFLGSAPIRVLGNPLVGPALVPLLSAILFFGPVPAWSIDVAPFGWVEQLALLVVGGLIVLPLVGAENPRSSLAVALSLAIGSFELVIDAVPGIALRLHRSLSTSYFDHRSTHSWSPAALHDQQTGGTILWCVAELIDLPFLILVFRQWLRADASEAADIDAVLEAERIARGSLARHDVSEPAPSDETGADEAGGEEAAEHGPTDAPWWLSDPAMQRRLNRPY